MHAHTHANTESHTHAQDIYLMGLTGAVNHRPELANTSLLRKVPSVVQTGFFSARHQGITLVRAQADTISADRSDWYQPQTHANRAQLSSCTNGAVAGRPGSLSLIIIIIITTIILMNT